MSDGVPMPTHDEHAGPSAGTLLKTAREAQGLHVAALAVSLKVPVKKLEALEADRLDLLPDAVFVRALASSMCRALKIDPTEILARLPQTQPKLQLSQTSSQTPFRAASDRAAPNVLTTLSRPAMLAVLALLLGALVLIFLPDLQSKSAQVLETTQTSDANAGSEATAGTALGAGAVLSSTDSLSSTVAGNDQVVVANGLPANTVTGVLSAPISASTSLVISTSLNSNSTTASTTTSISADSVVVFRAQGETWVEVLDVRGKTTLRRTLQAGESAGAAGALPLRVTVGRADQTEVLVRGQALDKAGKVRDNVLRFEVK
jgi:cytoskeleton protein RodZ